jgi:hypothetical protein
MSVAFGLVLLFYWACPFDHIYSRNFIVNHLRSFKSIFSILERHYILQCNQKSPLDPDETPPDAQHDPYYSTRPARYRHILLPQDWYIVGKNRKKRQDHKNHGVISFKKLSKMISVSWNETDDDTKAYCKRIATDQLEKYREDQKAFKSKYGEEAFDAQTRKRKNADLAAAFATQGLDKMKLSKRPTEDHEGGKIISGAHGEVAWENSAYARGMSSIQNILSGGVSTRAPEVERDSLQTMLSTQDAARAQDADVRATLRDAMMLASQDNRMQATQVPHEHDRLKAALATHYGRPPLVSEANTQATIASQNHYLTMLGLQSRVAKQGENIIEALLTAQNECLRAALSTEDDQLRAMLRAQDDHLHEMLLLEKQKRAQEMAIRAVDGVLAHRILQSQVIPQGLPNVHFPVIPSTLHATQESLRSLGRLHQPLEEPSNHARTQPVHLGDSFAAKQSQSTEPDNKRKTQHGVTQRSSSEESLASHEMSLSRKITGQSTD